MKGRQLLLQLILTIAQNKSYPVKSADSETICFYSGYTFVLTPEEIRIFKSSHDPEEAVNVVIERDFSKLLPNQIDVIQTFINDEFNAR